MGQYHRPVNLDKKEYLNPHVLGCGLKLWEQGANQYGTGTALIMLTACSNGRGGGDLEDAGLGIIGRWAGDRIAIIGDYAESTDLKGVDAQAIHNSLDPEYEDISEDVMKAMAAAFELHCVKSDGWRNYVDKWNAKDLVEDPKYLQTLNEADIMRLTAFVKKNFPNYKDFHKTKKVKNGRKSTS